MLTRFIPLLDLSFVDPSGESGFPLTVIACMPYLLSHYEDPLPICLEAAQLIAEVIKFSSSACFTCNFNFCKVADFLMRDKIFAGCCFKGR